MPVRRMLIGALVLTFLIALPAGAASAKGSKGLQTFYTFSVTFQGSGSFSQTSSVGGGAGGTVNASFNWATAYENVLIPRVHEPAQVGFPAFKRGSVATGSWKITSRSPDGSDDCDGAGTLGRVGAPGGGGVITDGSLTLKRVSGGLRMFALEGSGFSTASGGGDGVSPCHPQDFWHDVILSGANVGSGLPDGVEPLTGISKITPADLKRSSFVKTVGTADGELPTQDCGSDASNGVSCTQSYSWTGKVTFIKKKLKTKKH